MHEKETYGVIVYQEQIMQIASRIAGYSYAEADILRRAMSKKDRETLEENGAKDLKGKRKYTVSINLLSWKLDNVNIIGGMTTQERKIILSLRDDALEMHREKQGKLSVNSKVEIKDKEALSLAYSPGVAEPCKEIYEDERTVFDYTIKRVDAYPISSAASTLKIFPLQGVSRLT